MRTNKQIITALLVLGLAVAPTTALARGPHGGPGPHHAGGPAAEISPETWEQVKSIHQSAVEQAKPLMDDLWAGHLELKALSHSPNGTPEGIRAVVDRMVEQRQALDAIRTATQEKIAALGVDLPAHGLGFARHGMMGAGCGPRFHGQGCM